MTATDQTFTRFARVAALDHTGGFRAEAPSQVSIRPGGSVSNLLLRLLGGCMVIAATGIWLVPGAGSDPQMALIRVGISVVLLFLGLCLALTRERSSCPEIQFDAKRREMRVEEVRHDGRPVVILRRSYASIGAARFTSKSVQLLEWNGKLLIELPLEGRATRKMLRNQLADFIRVVR